MDDVYVAVGETMKRLAIVGAMMALTGCGAATDGRNEMLASKVALKTCLAQHPQDVQPCTGAMAAYQADLAAFQAMSPSGVMIASGDSQMSRKSDPQQDQVQPQSRRYEDFEPFGAR
jgi:hypothetical protein